MPHPVDVGLARPKTTGMDCQIDPKPVGVDENDGNDSDFLRFERELSVEFCHPPDTPASSGIESSGSDPSHHPTPTLGEVILAGMKQISDSQENRFHRIDQILTRHTSGTDLNSEDILRLQVEMLQLNMQHEITAKIAAKTLDGVQTLFRNQ